MTAPPLVIERLIEASPDIVWRAWTDPATMRQWYCPNPQWPVTASTDVRVGGDWRIAMGDHVVAGRYTVVDRPHRLAFTWRWESEGAGQDGATSVVEVELQPDGTGTRLVLRHSDLVDADDVKRHDEGWTLSLDRLPAAVA